MKKKSFEFILFGLPKTTNAGNRAHWAVKAKEARTWRLNTALAWKAVAGTVCFKTAELTLIRCSSSEPDFDGLVSTFKHVIDGLVDAGAFPSDKMSVIGQPKYQWEKTKRGEGCIRVKVEGFPRRVENASQGDSV